jgi:hypothetical protein
VSCQRRWVAEYSAHVDAFDRLAAPADPYQVAAE